MAAALIYVSCQITFALRKAGEDVPTMMLKLAVTLAPSWSVARTTTGKVPTVESGVPLNVPVAGLNANQTGGAGKKLKERVSVSFMSGSAKVPAGIAKTKGTPGIAN